MTDFQSRSIQNWRRSLFESEIQILNWSESLTQETIDKIVSLGRSTIQNEGSTSRKSETASRSVKTKLGRAKFQFCPPNYTNDAVKFSLISFHLWLRFSSSFQPNLILTAWELRFRCTGGSRRSRRFGKHSKSITKLGNYRSYFGTFLLLIFVSDRFWFSNRDQERSAPCRSLAALWVHDTHWKSRKSIKWSQYQQNARISASQRCSVYRSTPELILKHFDNLFQGPVAFSASHHFPPAAKYSADAHPI